MPVLKRLPPEIDYEKFRWLSQGDRLKIMKATGKTKSIVYRTLQKRSYHIDVLTEAMRMVVEKQKTILALQAESNEIEAKIKMRVAS